MSYKPRYTVRRMYQVVDTWGKDEVIDEYRDKSAAIAYACEQNELAAKAQQKALPKDLYVPLLRPASRFTLPQGIEWDYVEAPRLDPSIAVRRGLPLSKYDHGIIGTSRVLTKEEREQFGLRQIP